MEKILFILGTRPEAIKLAPVVMEFSKHHDKYDVKVCVTGQHGEMLYQVLDDFSIFPDFDLKVMAPNQTLSSLTSRLFYSLGNVLQEQQPDWVIVQGDTTTAMVGSLCAYYLKIKVGHVEAGLRSHDFWTPFPEELNRKIVALSAQKHFAPTEQAVLNLVKEGIPTDKIILTGNTVIDALQWMVKKVRLNAPSLGEDLSCLIKNQKKYVLITGHRRESFGRGFEEICSAIKELAQKYNNVYFVYPVHLNPNVQRPVKKTLDGLTNVILTDPLDYKSFVFVMDNCIAVLTDSGGVQEEAPSLGKPVLVMRNVTERMEGVYSGSSILVGTEKEKIISGVSNLLDNLASGNRIEPVVNPYGDGKAAEKIFNNLAF